MITCYFQILIAFYTQAMLNFVLLISSSGVWMVRTHREELHESLNKLKSELADDWVAMGLAMTIAALSQWSTISIFHLYLCTTFATTIPAVGFIRSDYTRWSQDPLRTIYFTAFRMSRIVLLSCFIYRFVQFWGNAPGQCFRFTKDPGIPGIPVASDDALGKSVIANMAILILVDILVGIEMLLHMSNANYRNRVAQITKAWDARHPFPLKPIIGASIILPSSILGINTVLASRTQIIGDENSFSFGQVTALVTLVASFYKMGKSIYSKPCVPS